jgi:adenosine deaminase CECR1
MNIHGWRQLAEWSIEYSCLSLKERAQAMVIFRTEWENFCLWIVKEYGDFAAGLDIKIL